MSSSDGQHLVLLQMSSDGDGPLHALLNVSKYMYHEDIGPQDTLTSSMSNRRVLSIRP